ncbi:MAG: hypothetical protein AAGB46_00780 [Verrucomicrobiota bacterium]
MAEDVDSGNFETFLDFDLSSNFSLYRSKEYDSTLRKNYFIFEVRNPAGEVVFSKQEYVSNNPEAYLVQDGSYLLSRSNDAETLQLALELHSITTGERIWRHTPEGSPRWRLSKDGRTIVEFISELAENVFHTAVAYDAISFTESTRAEIRNIAIRRQSDYFVKFDYEVGLSTGNSGTLLFNQTSRTLSPISGFRGELSLFDDSPKIDSSGRYLILNDSEFTLQGPNWAVYDSQNGERIASNLDLGERTIPFGIRQDPAISSNGTLVYFVVGYGRIEVWNFHTRTLVRELSYTNVPFEQLLPSSDDRYLLATALSGINDDFLVLIDTTTNLPIYSKIVNDPEVFVPSGNGLSFVSGFSRTLTPSPSRDRYYFTSTHGFEAFDLLSGDLIEDGDAFPGSAIASSFVHSQQSWITVYNTGRVRIEDETESAKDRWIQLPNTHIIKYAAIDSQSGSIAFQRDTAFFITHPFDDREDQWITNLGLGIHPISLHREGKWLAAHFRGIYDLETESLLPLDYGFYSTYAIDDASTTWALYDQNQDALIVVNQDQDSEVAIPLDGKIAHAYSLKFSPDKTKLYGLVQPESSTSYTRSLLVADIANKEVIQQIDLESTETAYPFVQMHVHPNENTVVLGRRNGMILSVNLDTSHESLPAIIEPIYSERNISSDFQLSPPKSDGALRFIDGNGNLSRIQPVLAHQIPLEVVPSSTADSQFAYKHDPQKSYWIQASENLINWERHPNPHKLLDWFHEREAGYFKVYESDEK